MRPLLTGTLGAAVISTSAILVKLAGLPATTTATLRYGYALPVLALLALLEPRTRRDPRTVGWRVLAGLLFAAAGIMQNLAVSLIGAGVATVICNLQVLVVVVGGWRLFGEAPPRRLLLAIPPALLGVVMVTGVIGGTATGADPGLGVLAGLANSLCYGGFLLAMRRAGTVRPVATLRDVTGIAALGAFAAALVVGDGGLAPSLPAHGWVLLLALGPQVAGWLLITVNLGRLPLAVSGLLLLLQPMLTMVLASVLLREAPAPAQLVGCLLLLAAIGGGLMQPKVAHPVPVR